MFTISFNCRTNWVKKYGNMLIWTCIQMTCNIRLSVHTVQEFKQYRQITPSYVHVLRVPVYTAIVLLMFMLSFFFFYKVQNVCGIFKWKRKCADFFLSIVSSYQVGNPLIGLTPSQFCTCPKQGLGFFFYVIFRGVFFFVQRAQLRWDVIVRFVDTARIDDHYCSNFLLRIVIVQCFILEQDNKCIS